MIAYMKKHKFLFSVIGLVLFLAAIAGTTAYFSKSFSSKNTAIAASFDVDVVNEDGTKIGDGQFNLDEELYPGMDTLEAYHFEIRKNNTSLPTEYHVNLEGSGGLFPSSGDSPISLTLEKKNGDKWEVIDHQSSFKLDQDTEQFRILVDWPHGDNDIQFQGKKGNIKLEVIATQVDEEEEPEGPPYYTGAIEFKVTPNGKTFKTADKEVNFYVENGMKVIEVYMGEEDEEFKEKVGDLRIVESVDDNGETWYRVYSENEYFASENQMWRVRDSSVDASTNGVLLFDKTLAPYLSIESQVLYDWFLANK